MASPFPPLPPALPVENVALSRMHLILNNGLHFSDISYQCFAAWSALGRFIFAKTLKIQTGICVYRQNLHPIPVLGAGMDLVPLPQGLKAPR